MATFTMSLSGSAIVNGSKSWTVNDADVQTLVNYMALKFSPDGVPLSNAAALLAWVQGFVSGTVGEIQARTRDQQAAALSIPPLSFT